MIKMKYFVLVLLLGCFGQTNLNAQDPAPDKIENIDQDSKVDMDAIKILIDQTVQAATSNDDVNVTSPEKPQTGDWNLLFDWWVWLYALLSPGLIYIMNFLWPALKKKDLVLRSTALAVVLLLFFVAWDGFTWPNLTQGFIAFIVQFVTYEKGYKPLGLASPAIYKNKNEPR